MQAIRTSGAVQAWVPRVLRLRRQLWDPEILLPIVLIGAFAVRAAWLALPPGTLIFDEAYYVNAARILLGWAVDPGAPYAGATLGLDPNIEHPPLGKLLLAGSMAVFGDNGLGWRVPSLLAGMVALGAIHRIVRAAGETAHVAIAVVALLAFDNLMLVHSRLGMLDMLALAPILVAAWLAIRERWAMAGALLAIGFLVKITAVFGLLALLIILAARVARAWREDRSAARDGIRAVAVLVVAFTAVAIAGLWLLDARFTTFATPFDHLRHMIGYGSSLTASIDHGGICTGITSAPWQWPFNTCQINYLRVDATIVDALGQPAVMPSIDFRGAMNPLLASAIPIASLTVLWRAWTTRDLLSVWAAAWIAANYLPYVGLVILTGRVTYLYYFLPAVPAIAVATAILLFRSGLPRFVGWGYLVAYAAGFFAYFPFRQIP